MKIGIMQPYFWPYLGYFQLIYAVDVFIIYDNIEYTKKGWFNRNRYLCSGKDKYFTIPIAKDSDYLNVKDRRIANSFNKEKLKNQIKTAYGRAPFFENVFPLFCDCIDYPSDNLFDYIWYSLNRLIEYFAIETKIIVSSTLNINHGLKGKDKVLEYCKVLQGDCYINPIGGICLYDKKEFQNMGIQLQFINMNTIYYHQFNNKFVEKLSILDVMMFNSKEEIKEMLKLYTLE